MQPSPTSLDYSALSRKVSFKERLHEKNYSLGIIACFAIGCITLLVGAIIYMTSGQLGESTLYPSIFGGFMLLVAAGIYETAANTIRMREFAAQNGFTYIAQKDFDGRGGIIFGEGHSKQFESVLVATNQAFSELGTYKYNTGSGKNERTHDYGYVQIKLPRRLPNIVLDSKKNNFLGRISNLPAGFSRDQKLELEGDFNSYFTLYAPAEYKTDALYVFTPDVMQALVDAAHEYDCEIIDDDFYLYSTTVFNLKDTARFEEIIRIAKLLKKELSEQTDYYADDRVGNRALNMVAHPGQRLKTRISTTSIVITTLVILYILWIYSSAFFN